MGACDCAGQPVAVGDLVAFPSRRGHYAYLNLGSVLEIIEDGPRGLTYKILTAKGKSTFKGPEKVIRYA